MQHLGPDYIEEITERKGTLNKQYTIDLASTLNQRTQIANESLPPSSSHLKGQILQYCEQSLFTEEVTCKCLGSVRMTNIR